MPTLLPLTLLVACAPGGPTPPAVQVLFLGNSYTAAHGMPEMTEQLAAAGGHLLVTAQQASPGNTLGAPQDVDQPHATNPNSLALIASTNWDFVVLQDHSCIPPIPSLKDAYTKTGAAILDAAIKANDPATVTLFFQTWARENGASCCYGSDCTAAFPDYDAMQDAVTSAYADVACGLSAPVAPVGEAWRAALAQNPALDLYDPDGSHPTLAGSYLASCVFYAVIFGQSPVGLSFDGGLPPAQAQALQQVAADVVLGPSAYAVDCAGPKLYCTPKASSAGCTARIGTTALLQRPVSGAGDYWVSCSAVQGLKNGLLFAGLSGAAALPFGGGTLCVQPPTKRGPIQNSGGSGVSACDGAYSQLVNDGLRIPFGMDAGPGNSAWYQWWYRDPLNGAGNLGTALSDAVELSFL